VNVLHHDLKPIEKLGLCVLYFVDEVECQVFVDDAVAGGKKSQYMFDEMALIVVELVVPVHEVCRQVYFFCCPKIGFRLFVKCPDVVVLDGEEYKTVGIFLQYRFDLNAHNTLAFSL